ncbi:MAG TPA: hypothetical protein VJB56_03215 [Candidatus Paceibacterota bacterium]
MGLFGDDKKVSKDELKDVRSRLSQKGFDKTELDDVDKVFHGELNERGGGATAKDVKDNVDWMRKNMGKHHFSKEEIDRIEQEMKKKL